MYFYEFKFCENLYPCGTRIEPSGGTASKTTQAAGAHGLASVALRVVEGKVVPFSVP